MNAEMTPDHSLEHVLRDMDEYTRPVAAESALLTIDVQRDFTHPDAPATVPGTATAIPNIASVVQQYREWNRPIIHVVRLYRSDGSNVDLCRRDTIENGKRVAVPRTDGSQIVTDLLPGDIRIDPELLFEGAFQQLGEHEWIMYKPRWGAFYETELAAHLGEVGATTLTVCGCNYPNCPRATIYEASERDFRIALVEDATSQTYRRGMNELMDIGALVLQTDDLDTWWTETGTDGAPV